MKAPARMILRRCPVSSLLFCGVICNLFLFTNCSSGSREAQVPTAASSNESWVKFQDPYEHAFTAEFPRGWTVKGGVFRLGFSDIREMVDLKSPDGKTNIRFGDVVIPTYTFPDQFYAREGEPYDLGSQGQMVVARYRPGKDFAMLYAQSRFRSYCQSITPQATGEPPPVVDKSDQDGDVIRTSAGQVSYRCDSREGVRTAYVYARTSLRDGSWNVPWLVSFIAPPEQVAAVRNVILRYSRSLQINPEFIRYQKEMDREGMDYQRRRQQGRTEVFNRQIEQFRSRMQANQDQVNAFQRQQRARTAQAGVFSDALVGVTPTIDPFTGENRKVWTGTKSSYWRNGLGETRNSDTSPGPGWHELEQPPHQ
jgi:hypothetical protein